MCQFTLFEMRSRSSVQLVEVTSATVLSTMKYLHWTEADLMRDGEYAFSLRLLEPGSWMLYRRNHVAAAPRPRSGRADPAGLRRSGK